MTAVTLLLASLAWPAGWAFNDLSSFPAARLALGGARATLTYPAGRPSPLATVVILPSRPMATPWPDDAAYWTARLIGDRHVIVTTKARLTRQNGLRTYRVETQADANAGGQLYSSVMAIEVLTGGERRLLIFRFEETPGEFRAGLPAVHALYARVNPVQDARAPRNLK